MQGMRSLSRNPQAQKAPCAPQRLQPRRLRSTCSVVVEDKQAKVKDAKATLLDLVEGTQRGARLSRAQRGAIEEAQVAVEATQATEELDYRMLGGYWMLRYTTAQDVIPILAADDNSPLRIGIIYQRFTSPDEGRGSVDNIIQAGIPFLLQDSDGVTITVQASYEVRSGHLIALTFDAANVGQLKIDPTLEAIIAPALLPRGSVQLAILQALRQFELKFPFRSAAQVAAGVASGNSRQVAGGQYHLTYLDEDMLIGRAIALGGTFVFTRAPEPENE